jgi:hypothetical protein
MWNRRRDKGGREGRYTAVPVAVHIVLVVDNDVAMIDTRIDGLAQWDLGRNTKERQNIRLKGKEERTRSEANSGSRIPTN